MNSDRPDIAVLIPCHNEEAAIAAVIGDVHAALPDARIVVCDNASSDRTADVARSAGATVIREPRRGKGNAVRRLLADVEADIYVLLDGDGTYDPTAAPPLIDEMQENGLDMISVGRAEEVQGEAYRLGHRFGNRMISNLVGRLFSDDISDVLSGYRIFSRRFVKSFPALSTGFEIETEMTVHALELRMPVAEHFAPYRERAEGTQSKLRTLSDGARILRTIIELLKEERPLLFFSVIWAALAILAVILGVPVILTYLETGLVPRLPTAILASSLMLLAFLALGAGLVLDSVSRARKEIRRLKYLEFDSPATTVIATTGESRHSIDGSGPS